MVEFLLYVYILTFCSLNTYSRMLLIICLYRIQERGKIFMQNWTEDLQFSRPAIVADSIGDSQNIYFHTDFNVEVLGNKVPCHIKYRPSILKNESPALGYRDSRCISRHVHIQCISIAKTWYNHKLKLGTIIRFWRFQICKDIFSKVQMVKT